MNEAVEQKVNFRLGNHGTKGKFLLCRAEQKVSFQNPEADFPTEQKVKIQQRILKWDGTKGKS